MQIRDIRGVDNERHVHHGVTTVSGLKCEGFGLSGVKYYIVPRVGQCGLADGIVERDVISLFCVHLEAAECHCIAVFGHCHGVGANGNGNGLAGLASAP